MLHKVTLVDEKNLQPTDIALGDLSPWSDFPEADHSKPSIGRVQVTNLKTGEVTKINNLVLIGGREILLQKLLGFGTELNHNIRYFQVGSGGCDVGTTPSKIGPYDDDHQLYDPVKFSPTNNLDNGSYKYIHDGKSKLIKADGGNIEIMNEDHQINTLDADGNSIFKTYPAKTTVKFTMFVLPEECNPVTDYPTRVFRFNEAALMMVDTESGNADIPAGGTAGDKFNASSKIFARFTTLNKYLEATDGLKIEWFILV